MISFFSWIDFSEIQSESLHVKGFLDAHEA